MKPHSSVRTGLVRARVVAVSGIAAFGLTLPWVAFPPGFAVYAAVLAVVVVLTSRRLPPAGFTFVWSALPAMTAPWAARVFYGLPPLLSLESLQAVSLMVAALGAAAVLFRIPQHRARVSFPSGEPRA